MAVNRNLEIVAEIRRIEAEHNAAGALPLDAILKLAKSNARDVRIAKPRTPGAGSV